jgi:hypothetical protein
MSSDYIKEYSRGEGIFFDILFDIRTQNSLLDIQLRTDFVTLPLKFKLL